MSISRQWIKPIGLAVATSLAVAPLAAHSVPRSEEDPTPALVMGYAVVLPTLLATLAFVSAIIGMLMSLRRPWRPLARQVGRFGIVTLAIAAIALALRFVL